MGLGCCCSAIKRKLLAHKEEAEKPTVTCRGAFKHLIHEHFSLSFSVM